MDIPLANKSIFDLDPLHDASELVMCCEVLEHLTDPHTALLKLLSITTSDLIVSVPNEPVWHLLNMARGKYLNALGNTPGHFQHWTKKQFTHFVAQHADIVAVHSPLPWTVIHCRPRRTGA
jgi:2-polyprenyl-3-methyl-5-hydroxy-6-metoxy-1,4-benzoquinol methylase